ncbi:hypothetical protein [Streptomyces sp900116325]|uniref:hypothetical protein n=1 Tax=Streptomyces sp. 900116325 TaxID=3154295 RepID=UPI003327A8A0
MTARTFDPDSTGRTPTAPPRSTAGRLSASEPSGVSRVADVPREGADGRTGTRDVEQIPGQVALPLVNHQPTLWSL